MVFQGSQDGEQLSFHLRKYANPFLAEEPLRAMVPHHEAVQSHELDVPSFIIIWTTPVRYFFVVIIHTHKYILGRCSGG